MNLNKIVFPTFQLPDSLTTPFDGRAAFAFHLATIAARTTLDFFRTSDYQVERKSDRSPVTKADQQAEQVIREALKNSFPDDGILGEEFGTIPGKNDYEWIIDPIDGTKSFISGVPLYSTLVGLTLNGKPIIGVIAIPALGEIIIAASGLGAWYGQTINSVPLPMVRAHVSKQPNLKDGLLVSSQTDNFTKRGAGSAYRELESIAYVSRTWGDGYGYLLVATGRAEVMIDPIVNPWDVAAVVNVIQEAGGTFTSWSGDLNVREATSIGSNGFVHEEVLSRLRPFAKNAFDKS